MMPWWNGWTIFLPGKRGRGDDMLFFTDEELRGHKIKETASINAVQSKNKSDVVVEFHPITKKEMSNGMRMYGKEPLTEEEIEIVKKAIREIEADESVFVFNHPKHLSNTCYNSIKDIVYIGRNIFPDTKYASSHPRDIMSIRAVLAHEYYGHRTYKEEYNSDIEKGQDTIPAWEDECRASITAAKISPGLTQIDRYHLVQDAAKRAEEFGQLIENDEFMRGVLYGYSENKEERNFAPRIGPIRFISSRCKNGDAGNRRSEDNMPEMQDKGKGNDNGFVR